MTEYAHVEKPFLDQLKKLDWMVVDQGTSIPTDPAKSLRHSFHQVILPDIFEESVHRLNQTTDGGKWLTHRQIEDLKDQLFRHPNLSLLEINEAVQQWLFKAQVDVNEVSGEADPVIRLIDFKNPQNNQFHAINQFRICLLYTSPSPRDRTRSRMPSSA